MSFSSLFIRRPVATSLLALSILLAGAIGYAFVPVASLPAIDFPTVEVTATLPGAEPDTMASAVAAPLERKLGQIAGVTEMTSTSSVGQAVVVVQFDLGRSADRAARDVQAAINAAAADLPADLSGPPTWRKVNPADTPILVLAVTTQTLSAGAAFDAANDILAQRVAQLSGVGQVAVSGAQKSAVRIGVDPNRLAALGLGLEDVRNAVAATNAAGPLGLIGGPHQAANLAVNDQALAAAAYRPLVLRAANGAVIRLDAVADVRNATEDNQVAAWFNRDPAVLVIIYKQPGANVVQTVDSIKAQLPQLRRWMPAGIDLAILTDQTGTIRASLADVQVTLGVTALLVVSVVYLFLRETPATMAAAVTVPLSIAGTLAVMGLLGYSLDNLSLMALTVSIGFVVDDAIVMIENIARHRDEGSSALEAATDGAREISFTVVSITVSLVAVYIPLLLMGGLVGRLFREFAVTLTVAVAISALISLTLTPMLCGRFVTSRSSQAPRFGRLVERCLASLQDGYAGWLDIVLRHRRLSLLATTATVLGTVALYAFVPKGFFPEQDTGLLLAVTEGAPDISFGAMRTKQQSVTDRVLRDPDVGTVGSLIGVGGGNASVNEGRLFIRLKPPGDRADHAGVDAIMARLEASTADLPGVQLYTQAVQDLRVGGRLGKGTYQFTLTDADLGELEGWTPKVVSAMSTIPGLLDAASDQIANGPQIGVTVDRAAAARLGVSMAQVDAVLDDAFAQRQISKIYTSNDTYHVVLEVATPWVEDPAALGRLYVPGQSGTQVPLSAFARVEHGPAPLSITHDGQFPSATVSFNLAPDLPIGTAIKLISARIDKLSPPPTLHTGFTGTAAAVTESLSDEPILLLTALLTVYLVLGVLYESAVHPLTILSALPTAGIGALIALWATGEGLTIIGLIGIILLMGIVMKNAVILVDFALAAERRDGLTSVEAIRHACIARFRPILMTSLAALLGALPLALGHGTGSELRHPPWSGDRRRPAVLAGADAVHDARGLPGSGPAFPHERGGTNPTASSGSFQVSAEPDCPPACRIFASVPPAGFVSDAGRYRPRTLVSKEKTCEP